MTKQISASDFINGNFIKEVDPIITGTTKKRKRRRVLLNCLCCNKSFIVDLWNALRTQQKCCCLACFNRLTEDFPLGNEKHPLYTRWLAMNQRCNNPASSNYPNYGGRGIKVSKSISTFKDYVDYVMSLPNAPKSFPTKLQVDRVNNDGDYSKGNLRWTDSTNQVLNQRKRKTAKYSKYIGVTFSLHYQKWVARVKHKGITIFSKMFDTESEALEARNDFIKLNNLPHKIQ